MNRHHGRSWIASVLIAVPLLVAVPATAQVASDALRERLRPQGYVSDFANLLDPADRQALENRLAEVDRSRGAQIAVVTLASLEGGEINDFANKLYRQWGVGEKEKNNGVLLLVARDDRKARIEVGYGLEPILPDTLAGRVLDDDLFPAFRQKKYSEGLKQTGLRIAEIVEKNEPAASKPNRRRIGVEGLLGMLALSLFGGLVLGGGFRGRVLGSVVQGLLFTGIAVGVLWWNLSHPGLLLGLVSSGVGTLLGLRSPTQRTKGRRYASNDGWIWFDSSSGGGSSGGGGFDWGGGSGGFSGFGGGDSGGGGASGGW